MCRQNSCVRPSVGDPVTSDESLLVYCKPVELYNILHRRARHNPSFLQRCLRFKVEARRQRRLKAGVVIFNYKDYNNKLQKTEVTEDFSCPFCLMQCASFKGLRYHLCSSHDLFNFEFWATEEYQAVNVSVKVDTLGSETIANGVDQRQSRFLFCSRPRSYRPRKAVQNGTHVCVQFLEVDLPKLTVEGVHKEYPEKNEDSESYQDQNASKSSYSEKHHMNGEENHADDSIEHVASSFNLSGVPIASAQSSGENEWGKLLPGSDSSLPATLHVAKTRKISMERSDPRNRALLLKRQFYHSHRVQPMALDQVMSERDSEDEVDDDIADLEDRRMLDDFVDVSKDEKELMHLWNSFVRKQRVLADGHVPWACEAFTKLHGQKLIQSPPLFWCWRLFMIKLWNHGLLDAGTMNSCSIILESCRIE
ncbi:polycomb group protein EMBRYONIC FLOWER 2-like [Tripterygium wilfordii]|uniref:polycomb group protein EMBRYONIC FLOWER 2-like n=1 Tax=Tripterygium wilfordii TaxID=458696 RepID=UPI0018F81884|nr:polycomb group protein EMBRYONIC FLOWER 2-like [Tripterygium wilfordii]